MHPKTKCCRCGQDIVICLSQKEKYLEQVINSYNAKHPIFFWLRRIFHTSMKEEREYFNTRIALDRLVEGRRLLGIREKLFEKGRTAHES